MQMIHPAQTTGSHLERWQGPEFNFQFTVERTLDAFRSAAFVASPRPAPVLAALPLSGSHDRSDIDLPHSHHCFERALGRRLIGISDRFDQDAR
jgi:hypothetical protein